MRAVHRKSAATIATAATYAETRLGLVSTRTHLHELVDGLPESEVGAAERFLEYLNVARDPLLRALASAPIDDETESDEELTAVAEGRAALRNGEIVSDQELRRQLGI